MVASMEEQKASPSAAQIIASQGKFTWIVARSASLNENPDVHADIAEFFLCAIGLFCHPFLAALPPRLAGEKT
jgi:hypothetical protein